MIHAQNSKFVPVINPQAIVDNDAPVGAADDGSPVSIDTRGYQYAVITLYLGATDIACTACKLLHGDATNSMSAMTGSDFNSTGHALPSATDDGGAHRWYVDLRDKKRYIQVDVVVGNGTAGGYYVAWAELFRADEHPITDTERNLNDSLFV